MPRPNESHRFRGPALLLTALLIGFVSLAAAADANLAWSPNGEADLAGYGIYSRRDVDGPPYDLIGYIALEELPDRDNPSFTVSGLEQGFSYYFAATAYDTAGNESNFSISACATVGDQIGLCNDTVNGSGGGGGGGGGCFIRTLMP